MSAEATNREAAVALAEALGNLPLALEQAAAYAEQTGLSLADYLELFREHAAAYAPPARPSADYPEALAITFEIAFKRISQDLPAAADLLTLCAFLAPDDVPLEIFKEVSAKKERRNLVGRVIARCMEIFERVLAKKGVRAVLPEALASALTNPDALAAAAAMLEGYALAKARGGSFLSTHRLTQAVARDRLTDDERNTWAEAAVTLMQHAFTFKQGDTRTLPPSALLLQHALTAAEHANALGVASQPVMRLMNMVVTYLFNNTALAEAKAALARSVELRERRFGPLTHSWLRY